MRSLPTTESWRTRRITPPKASAATGATYPLGASVLLNALWTPLFIQDTALLLIAVPAVLLHLAPRDHVHALAIITSIVSVVPMIVLPLSGAASDALRRRGIPRRSLVFAGIVLDVAALVLLPASRTTFELTALMTISMLGFNVSFAAYSAMLPEIVPQASWGSASGVRGVAVLIGTLAGFTIGAFVSPAVVFLATAASLVVFAFTLFAVAEPKHKADGAHAQMRDWHDFSLVFVARAWIALGLSLLYTFVFYFFSDILHAKNPPQGTALVGAFGLVGAVVSSIAAGSISDRFPRKYVVALCGVPMTLAAIGFAAVPSQQWILAFAVLFGFGYGGLNAVGWALAFDAMPALGDIGRDLGIWGIAQNLPAVIAPAVGYWLIARFGGGLDGYRALFAAAALSFLFGSITTLGVRGTAAAKARAA
jgi:MFS family permease